MVGAVRRATIKVSGVMALSVQLTMTHNTTSPLTALPTEPSGRHTPISFYYTDYFKLGAEAVSKRKHFARTAKPLRGRSDGMVT